MFTHGVDLKVIVNGTECFEFWHNHQGFIEGRKGHDYQLHFKNNSHCRKKLVVSVDGLNVLTGDSTWEKAYVLDRFGTLVVPGWRIDDNSVAKFVFSTVGESYNQQNASGAARNIGVIGCKLFNEKFREAYKRSNISADSYNPEKMSRRTRGDSGFLGIASSGPIAASGLVGSQGSFETLNFCSTGLNAASAAPAVENSVGTGWGNTENFKTREVYYDFEPHSVGMLMIYYDSLRGLQRRGIDTRLNRAHSLPDPFPSQPRDGCPYPERRY